MSLAVLLAICACVAAGVYLALSRDLFRIVLGLAVLGSGVNLIVLAAGRMQSPLPPIIAQDAAELAPQVANPLPQALVLTAIVIGFALLCFGLVLAARLADLAGSEDAASLDAGEPPGGEGDKPPVLPS
jgi:multicomponent Na+:H+ antiporter subunit C